MFVSLRQELEKSRIDLQAIEVQNYLRQEIQRKEDLHRTELTHQQEKYVVHHSKYSHSFSFRLHSLAVEYKKLEDEFRDALKIEERRYQEVNSLLSQSFSSHAFQLFKTNEILQKENELLQLSSTNIKQREESDRKMINDLTQVQ